MPSDGKIASKAEIPRTKFQPRLNFMPGERYSVNGAVGILVCVCNVTCGWSRDELQREPGSLDCWENTSKTFPTLELGCSPKATSTPCLLGKLSRSCKACGLSFRFLCTLSLEMLDSSLGIWGKFPNFEVRGGSHFRLGSCEFFFALISWCQKNLTWSHIWRLAEGLRATWSYRGQHISCSL
jgi:hypothetical protein